MKRFDHRHYHIYLTGMPKVWTLIRDYQSSGTLYKNSCYRKHAIYCLDIRVSRTSLIGALRD